MSEEDKPEKPDPIEDVRKGLGLLFRAAKSALDQLPTRGVEDAVLTGAREVGRAIENVTSTLDKQFFKRDAAGSGKSDAPPRDAPPADASRPPPEAAGPKEAEDPPKGPRVG